MSKASPFFYALNVLFVAVLLAVVVHIGTLENERYRIISVDSIITELDHTEFVDYQNTGYSQFANVKTRMLLLLQFEYGGTTYLERFEFTSRGLTKHKIGDSYAVDIITKDGKFQELYSDRYPIDRRMVFVVAAGSTWLILFILQLAFLGVLDEPNEDQRLRREEAVNEGQRRRREKAVAFVPCGDCARRIQEINQ